MYMKEKANGKNSWQVGALPEQKINALEDTKIGVSMKRDQKN